jgi:hypothetical protein
VIAKARAFEELRRRRAEEASMAAHGGPRDVRLS